MHAREEEAAFSFFKDFSCFYIYYHIFVDIKYIYIIWNGYKPITFLKILYM